MGHVIHLIEVYLWNIFIQLYVDVFRWHHGEGHGGCFSFCACVMAVVISVMLLIGVSPIAMLYLFLMIDLHLVIRAAVVDNMHEWGIMWSLYLSAIRSRPRVGCPPFTFMLMHLIGPNGLEVR